MPPCPENDWTPRAKKRSPTIVTCASTLRGPPAGSTCTGRGANEGGTPDSQAAAASATIRMALRLEELKAGPQEKRGGADRAGERGELRVAVPGPSQLGKGKDAGESVLDPD